MAKKSDVSGGKQTDDTAQAAFLVTSVMSAVVPMIEAKCGAMNKRDRGTLQRHVEKAVRAFVRQPFRFTPPK
jgi:hypothetical protein